MNQIGEKLHLAKNGDHQARNQLIEEYQQFIYQTACRICKKKLTWGQDDELSIALMAFNEAIDSFKPEAQVPFWGYAKVVIRSRLIDYFRQESQNQHIPCDFTHHHQAVPGKDQAWENSVKEIEAWEREEEIRQYEEELKKYGINFEVLVRNSPKHRDSRANLITTAKKLALDQKLFQHLEKHKKVPLQELCKVSPLSKKTLEKHRPYIIALALIFHNPERYPYLYSYLKFSNRETTRR
ncbi:MAG: Sigma-70 region 2 domain protein [Thermoanaerobacterales bacterium 50_218]|nr:MAG: Sigma-70 region 2 domain protein [Thermoanaerobacterales bacterium 50_218]HAA89429.1 RNA polymerase sigma-I factor [Peptococcaceae bacterium]